MIQRGCYWNTKLAQQEYAVPVVGDKKMLSLMLFFTNDFADYRVVTVKTFVSCGCKVPCQALR